MRDFRELDDPQNPENRNAGNGGDLVKHAVYLALLRHLGPGLRSIRECHAGRGIYRVPRDDPRRRRLARLSASSTPLAEVQRAVLSRLEVDPEQWYAGSALLIAEAAPGVTSHEAYEWDPATRSILRASAAAGHYPIEIVDPGDHFDGETHVAESISQWGSRDLVLLDPFGLWRHLRHDERRARYRRILEARRDCPMAIFFTWGQDARGEAVDCEAEIASNIVTVGHLADAAPDDETRRATPHDGYGALRALLSDPVLRVRWRSDLRCAMWIAGVDLAPLHANLAETLCALWRDVLDPADGIEIALTLTRSAG
jgi:hypothetical protein